jgi:microcystin degradation protein MlrC
VVKEMKIAVGQIAHETNTFSSEITTLDHFESWELLYGEEIIKNHRNVRDYLGGIIDRSIELNLNVIPTLSAFAMPSGTITKETKSYLISQLVNMIKEEKELDGICLALHGAGVADGSDDLEGDVLAAIREAAGYDIPIVVTLDLHANVTEKMVKEADILLGVNYYPHVDSYERGVEAVDYLVKMIEGELKPSMYLEKLPLVIPTSTTNLSPAKDINNICWAMEGKKDVVDCTFFHGFPYTDIPDLGVSVLTVTNNDPELAKSISKEVGSHIWEVKDQFFPHMASPKEGIRKSVEIQGGPIVINETSDNPGGGTPGDGTFLLSAMIEDNLQNACFGFICDPEVVKEAHRAGVGSTIDTLLGGKTDRLHGEPIPVSAYVKALADGKFIQSSPMWRGLKMDYGKSARLQVNGIDIIVCSKKSQTLDEQIFLLHGIDVSTYKVVALKSSQHFRAAFEPIAQEIITVDSPGLSSFQLDSFSFTRVKKGIYPITS